MRSRVEDTVRLCDKRGVPCFLGFLDLHEQAYAQQVFQSLHADSVLTLYGGYADAERIMLAVSPPQYVAEECDYPFSAVAFQYRAHRQITHRDVLGTLMSLGIRREAIGDILCGEGISVVFARNEIVDFICEHVDRIGGEGVSVIPYYDGDLPIQIEFESIRESVASPRLDSVVKALVRCSREQAAEMIRFGRVSVNHLPVESITKTIVEGDTISIRGCGRFHIDQIGPNTKKGRLALFACRRT
ncbi:MAG: hypothetical protein IKZ36_04465 [Kiritimatiellae bacterium]|nr:hypothetical protein [Kiritimatiellia bacterium]